jgi:hypothetical protein
MEYDAELEFIGSAGIDGQRIVLRAEIPSERFQWLKVYSDGGQSLELSRRGQMQVGVRRTYTFVAPRAIPRAGKLVAGILTGDQTVRIPFALTNISMLGQPLAAR